MAVLNLDDLAAGIIPGIDAAWGTLMRQAVIMAMAAFQHPPGTELELQGMLKDAAALIWEPIAVTDQMQRAWRDTDDIAEYAASGIACLLIRGYTEYTVIERAYKDRQHGFDYWLGVEDDPLFTYRGRLEISGIYRAKRGQLRQRVQRKREQVAASHHLELPAYIVVVALNTPRAHMERQP